MFPFLALIVLFAVSSALPQYKPVQFYNLPSDILHGGIKSMKIQPRIANGNRANVGDFPWHASLVIKKRDRDITTYCSGAILNEKWILATADCIVNASAIRVNLGSIDINNPLISVLPNSLTLHPQFDRSKFQNNIALLRLAEKLNFTADEVKGKIAPIRLPQLSQKDNAFVGNESYFSGFGYSFINSKQINEYLSFVEQKIIPNSACVGYYGNDAELISSKVICASSFNMRQGACMGDGGAPLVVNEYGTNTLVGLLNFIHQDGSCGRQPIPTVFTRITSYLEWIRQITG